MDIKLSQDEVERIKEMKEHHRVIKFLANKDRLKFNVGDILIRKVHSYDYHENGDEISMWEIETTHDRNALPRRYVYVHEDEFGVGYIKRLKVSNGELGEELICLADSDPHIERYEVDPLYLDSVLIGDGSFNIKELQKKEKQRKKEVEAFNEKASVRVNSLSEANELLSKLNVGSKFWTTGSDNFLGLHPYEYKITSISIKYIARLSLEEKYYLEGPMKNNPQFFDSKKVTVIKYIDQWGDEDKFFSYELMNKSFYFNKPLSLMERS